MSKYTINTQHNGYHWIARRADNEIDAIMDLLTEMPDKISEPNEGPSGETPYVPSWTSDEQLETDDKRVRSSVLVAGASVVSIGRNMDGSPYIGGERPSLGGPRSGLAYSEMLELTPRNYGYSRTFQQRK